MQTLLWAAAWLGLASLAGAGDATGAPLSPVPPADQVRVLLDWTFDHAGDLRGWQPNGHLREVAVTNGALRCRAEGSDPILELRPLLDLSATPWQILEVRLKADRHGEAEWFWGNTSTGRYGGFSQEKSARFQVQGDSQWHDYRLMPFWHPEGRIVRLRFDVYDGARFEIERIRLLELNPGPVREKPEFDFVGGAQGWQGVHGARVTSSPEGLAIQGNSPDAFALAPPLRIDADEAGYVAMRLAVNQGSRAVLSFATEAKEGLQTLSFPVEADGREHTYNVDLLAAPAWRGRVLALGLRPSEVAGAQARVRWLKVAAEPQGPPQLAVVSFALEDALPRAGVPVVLSAVVSNSGGEPATNLQAALRLPEGVLLLSASPAGSPLRSLGFGGEATWTWRVQCRQPLARDAMVTFTSANAAPVSGRAVLQFTPRLRVARTGVVPEPKPVRGPFEVGAYYFPGWKTASQWQPLQRFPERRPVLGWYREGEPEVADWHIKWAVEHGITFFAYDWYWSQGARQLEHALHDGYFKARYRHLLKFCLLWANHNPPRTSSREDCVAVTRYWIENYFRRPEHLVIDGKPVVIIFSMERLTQDLGSAGVKEAFEAMRAECRQAGLKGLYLIACVGGAGGAREAAAEGYDAMTAYNWPGLGMSGSGNRAPFEGLLEGYRRNWEQILEQSPIPLTPLPVCGGWDSRPWHGENNLVRFGRTPALFQRHLQDAKRLLETDGPKSGPRNLVLVEAWNEWGEGSYIEPHQEFGFGYLDAIRAVFTDAPAAHEDVTPADAGLGPYDVPPLPPAKTAWNFARSDEGWSSTMGLADVAIRNGALSGRTTDRDPAFFGPPLQARAERVRELFVRMKLQPQAGPAFKDTAQVFWSTSRLPESEASSERFEIIGDGQWHDYKVPLAQNRRWRGLVTRLRLDPCNQAGVRVELGAVRLQ